MNKSAVSPVLLAVILFCSTAQSATPGLFFSSSPHLLISSSPNPSSRDSDSRKGDDRAPKTAPSSMPLSVGEKFAYEVSWADFVVAGELTIETRERRPVDGVDAFHLVASAQSVGLVRAAVFKVDDVYESFVDASTLEPFRAQQQIRHGKKHDQQTVNIDQRGRKATFGDGRAVNLQSTTYDLLGLLCAIRTMDFKSAKPRTFTLIDEDKLYDLQVEVEGRERVTTRAGAFDCVRLATRAIDQTRSDPYKLRIFVSDDSRRIPVQITAEPRWGGVRVELVSANGVKPVENPKPNSRKG